ncbi:MAG TPA: VCBS repeat-containing protein, partial [Adhaeribacter sp.]|nr:VCBS repeat-containing protein [Adhaeribacter sp.]
MKQLFTLVFCIFSFSAWSQQVYDLRQKNDIKVVIGTDTLANPWAGGLNAPVYSKIDLNHDGTEDLYAFDRMTNKSYTFLAENAGGTWRWKYAPEYEAFFPQNSEFWVLLVDYDGDGRKDLFTANSSNSFVYRNLTPLNGPLTFAPPRVLRFDAFPNMNLGPYVLPALADIDNDGDLDMLVFDNGNAENVEYYKNLSKELYNHADSLRFTRDSMRWGRFSRCGPTCNTFATAGVTCRVDGTMHGGGGSILAIDLDGDNDKDLLIGSDMCPDLVRITNTGTPTLANTDANSLVAVYPTGTTQASVPNFPASYYEDVTFDGKKDLLVAPFLLDNADFINIRNASWLYQNTAATATAPPVFTFVKNNFLQGDMVDVGEASAPVFADIDADGDMDMLVSNYASYQTGTFRSTVNLFTNIGTATKPLFKLTDPDYLQFSAADYKGIKLQFADMNGDGSLDLIVKQLHATGSAAYIDYIPNSALAGQPFSFSRGNQTQLGLTINPTDTPFFYDIDNDGDLDLLVGTESQNGSNPNSGAIWYYQRVGTAPGSFSSWQLVNDNVGGISRNSTNRFRHPFLADLNNDGRLELLTADNSGTIAVYPDIMANLSGTVTGQNNLVMNQLQNNFIPTNLGRLLNVASRNNLHLAVADLDGDQKPEIVS